MHTQSQIMMFGSPSKNICYCLGLNLPDMGVHFSVRESRKKGPVMEAIISQGSQEQPCRGRVEQSRRRGTEWKSEESKKQLRKRKANKEATISQCREKVKKVMNSQGSKEQLRKQRKVNEARNSQGGKEMSIKRGAVREAWNILGSEAQSMKRRTVQEARNSQGREEQSRKRGIVHKKKNSQRSEKQSRTRGTANEERNSQ
jgi:hypothetical protein